MSSVNSASTDPTIIRNAIGNSVTLIEAAEACFASHLDPVACAPELQSIFQVDAPTLAAVLAAVWWATMTQAILVSALTAAFPGTPVNQLTTIAQSTLAVAHGIMMRKALGDTGAIPYPGSAWWSSPDIIPSGTTPVSNPQTFFTQNWNSDVGQNIKASQTNYIYVRGKNLFPGPESGTIALYWADAGVSLNPSQWGNQPVPTAPAAVTAANSNDIVVGQTAFTWSPALPPAGSHYCLIARVATPYFPNPTPSDSTWSTAWFLANPAFAWRNVGTVPMAAGAQTHQINFGSADDAPGKFLLIADCKNLAGSTLALASKGAVAFDTGPQSISANDQQISVPIEMPAHYAGKLQVSFGASESGATSIGRQGSAVNVRLMQVVSDSHGAYALSRTAEQSDIRDASLVPPGTRSVFLGNFIFQFE